MLKHLIFIFLIGASAHSCVMNAHAEEVKKLNMTEVRELAGENNWSVKDLKTMCDDIDHAADDVRESEAIQRIEEVFEDSDAVCELLK